MPPSFITQFFPPHDRFSVFILANMNFISYQAIDTANIHAELDLQRDMVLFDIGTPA